MISLKKINKSYHVGKNDLHVLKGVDMEVEAGEFVSIMGSSGSGKSTLLNILGILDDYDSGDYKLGGTLIKNLTQKKAAQYRNQFIGFVFQSFNLIGFKNAMENVSLPLYYQGLSRRKRNDKALAMLENVGIKEWAEQPTGSLDSKTSQKVMYLLTRVNKDLGLTIVIVTHEHAVAASTHRVIR